ncbi:hypothetical protein MF672_033885 [Actinomadura sp. ATCC 31491]|uniref:DUF222 domain-containing protein n=1 Tax=Actinomadura luzonensis TaxID=2805427 RepID=A0ABT0G2D1_9ACTN|nr:hypothetical protein [Actinomadura luzonensis]MCK2218749.1 hypothetical protein [Actinomadura luzonensis]
MEVHKRRLRSVADVFDQEREELARFVAGAARELEAIGDFRGDGKEGAAFFKGQGGAGGYEAVTGQIMAGTEAWLGAHREIAARLRLMAASVDVADWESIAAILERLPPADPGRPVWGTG